VTGSGSKCARRQIWPSPRSRWAVMAVILGGVGFVGSAGLAGKKSEVSAAL